MTTHTERLAALGLTLPPVTAPAAAYVPAVRTGSYIYVSGQVSSGPDGKVVGAGDMRAQCDQVFKNLTNVLRAAGAGWNDVIKMNGYMVGINAENVAAYREVRSGYLKAKQLPASTLVGVTSLVQPELLLEVEVVAALGN